MKLTTPADTAYIWDEEKSTVTIEGLCTTTNVSLLQWGKIRYAHKKGHFLEIHDILMRHIKDNPTEFLF
jgi:hypothetical protein